MNTNEFQVNDGTSLDPENQNVVEQVNPSVKEAVKKDWGKKIAAAMGGVAAVGAGAGAVLLFSSFTPVPEDTAAHENANEPVVANEPAAPTPVSAPQHLADVQTPAGEIEVPDEPLIHIGTPVQIEIDGEMYSVVPVYSGDNHEMHSLFIDTDGDGLYDAVIDTQGNMYASNDFSFGEIVGGFEGHSLENFEQNTEINFVWNINSTEDVVIPTEDDSVILVSDEDVVAPLEVYHENVDGYDVAYVPTVVEGQEAVLIDGVHTDADGNFVPENADGVFDVIVIEGDVHDIHEAGITIDDVLQHADPAPDFNDTGDTPYSDYGSDFNNDADINHFI